MAVKKRAIEKAYKETMRDKMLNLFRGIIPKRTKYIDKRLQEIKKEDK